jgi:hypothetical protein
VALGVAIVIGTPLGLRAVPAKDSNISAVALLARVQRSYGHPYSGYVESVGTLELPVADHFTDVGSLLGDRTRMRVWWRGSDDWRVDKVLPTGETDYIHDAGGTTKWEYEKSDITRNRDPDVRLPRASDLVPPELARRLLVDADPADFTRLGARHVAGLDALGLRLSVPETQASIDHVDIWVDPSTAIPVRVEIHAKGANTSAFTSEFMTFTSDTPAASLTRFTPPVGSHVSYDNVVDVADAANQFAPLPPPPRSLAGLRESGDPELRAVGIYGRGVTKLIAIPLWEPAASPLREQLQRTPGVEIVRAGSFLQVGPLSVLLTKFTHSCGGWLIAGTVTRRTVIAAAHQVAAGNRVVRR